MAYSYQWIQEHTPTFAYPWHTFDIIGLHTGAIMMALCSVAHGSVSVSGTLMLIFFFAAI